VLDSAAIERACVLLAPGGTLQLVEILQPRLRRDHSWDELVERLTAAEERLAALASAFDGDATSDVDFESDGPLAEPEEGAVYLPVGPRDMGRWARIDLMITRGWPVLLQGPKPPSRLLLAVMDEPADVPLRLAALRDLLAPSVAPTLLTPTRGRSTPALEDRDVADLLGVESVEQALFVRLGGSGAPTLRQRLAEGSRPLVVLPMNPALSLGSTLTAVGLLSGGRQSVLVVPARPSEGDTARWEASDLVRLDDRLTGAVERPTALGPSEKPDLVMVTPVIDGRPRVPVPVLRGQLQLVAPDAGHVGIAPTQGAGVHAIASVLELSDEPLELVFLGADPPRLPPSDHSRVGVRLDADQPLARLRRTVEQLGFVGLIDAGAVLQDGSPSDLPDAAANARARRVTARLVAAGYPIAGSWLDGVRGAPPSGDRLGLLTGARRTTATRATLLWDNRRARRRRLDLFDGATQSIDLQTYQVMDDPAAQEIELALARAAARGVRVRVLADAVWSARGTADTVSPTLARLEKAPGLEVRLVRPFSGVPGLEDLKRRDHRKVLIVDGAVSILGGRNLGGPYLRGFDEIPLWRTTRSADVPWLDLDVELQGPVVDQLAEGFEGAWKDAQLVGEIGQRPPASPTPPATAPAQSAESLQVRLVTHEGLRDAYTLDLYRDLIDSARERLTIVNTFPLQFELVTALGRALDRGVAVRVLVGNVRPLFGDRQPFAGGNVLELANEVIHGRLDELVAAGAAVHEYALLPKPGWDPSLGRVLPHVHAKCISADGQRFTVGTANLDITAAYWESEVVLLVEDLTAAEAFDEQLDALFAGSPQISPDDERWQRRARGRAWLSRNWPSTLG